MWDLFVFLFVRRDSIYYRHMYMPDPAGDRSGGRKIIGMVDPIRKTCFVSEAGRKGLKTDVYADRHARAGGAGESGEGLMLIPLWWHQPLRLEGSS